MDKTRNEIYLAALLHDIGKFYQRADDFGVQKSQLLSPEIKKLESIYCPVYKGQYSRQHVLWTAQFFQDFQTHFQNLLAKQGNSKVDALMRLAAMHHNPEKEDIGSLIVQKSDHYASGIDRVSSKESIDDMLDESEKSWDSFRRIKMRSIFEGINLNNDHSNRTIRESKYIKKLPLEPITFDKSYFPSDTREELPDYKKLWSEFTNDAKFLQTDSFRSFGNTLLSLLEKFTSRIPASTRHLPDVSLFDHAKMSAAFALCLYDYIEYHNLETLPGSDKNPFLLIGGDLSGIQKFIYGIIAKGAAKNLKGRSFYLQLLIDNIVKTIVDDLNLSDANIVYASGGGFYLLAPNTAFITETLAKTEKEISEKLFEYHQTELFLSLDYSCFGEEEIFSKIEGNKVVNDRTLGDVWAELTIKLSFKKKQRFIHKIKKDYSAFFEPGETGGTKIRDDITGEEINDSDRVELDKGIFVSKYTKQQIVLGQKLRDVDFWIMADENIPYFKNPFNPIGIGKFNYFVRTSEIESNEDKLRKSADKVRVMAINKLNFLEPVQKGIDNIYGFYFYGGNKFPADEKGNPKTFEEISGVIFNDDEKKIREKSPSLLRMGVLRMDVDNLGRIFKGGFSPEKRSFSRYSTLSHCLDYFFKGYLNEIWKDNQDYKIFTQIIYSGGDDLFIVGKWDILIRMAQDINQFFREWTCHNEDLTLSGGIAFVYPKFPVLKASLLSGDEEKNAKSHNYKGKEKNSFSLFGYAFNWEYEYPVLLELKSQIKDLMNKHVLSQGFGSDMFNMLQKGGFVFDEVTKSFRLTNYQIIWFAAYNFKRAMQRSSDKNLKDFLTEWINRIYTGKIEGLNDTKYHALQIIAVAARWANLELRN